MPDARPRYVGSVLQRAGLLHGYFDVYTSTAHPMNVYSTCVAKTLGFSNEATARQRVAVLEHCSQQFATAGDRAGQHHALAMALVMFDRARWTGQVHEANIFRQWFGDHLTEKPAAEPAPATAAAAEPVPDAVG